MACLFMTRIKMICRCVLLLCARLALLVLIVAAWRNGNVDTTPPTKSGGGVIVVVSAGNQQDKAASCAMADPDGNPVFSPDCTSSQNAVCPLVPVWATTDPDLTDSFTIVSCCGDDVLDGKSGYGDRWKTRALRPVGKGYDTHPVHMHCKTILGDPTTSDLTKTTCFAAPSCSLATGDRKKAFGLSRPWKPWSTWNPNSTKYCQATSV